GCFFFSSRRRHTRCLSDWSSDVCSSDLVLGAVGWARPARLVRGVVLSAKERDFVRAARGFGATDGYLLRRHILPATSSVLLTQAAILVPQFILAERSEERRVGKECRSRWSA